MKSENIRFVIRKDKHLFSMLALCVAEWILFDSSLNYIHTEVAFTLFLVIGLGFFFEKKALPSRDQSFIFLALTFMVLFSLYKVLGISSALYGSISGYYSWIIISIAGVYVNRYFTHKEKKIVFFSTLIIVMWNIVSLYLEGQQQESFYNVFLSNASYSSMIMLFGGSSLVWFLHEKKLLFKIMAIVAVIASTYINVIVLQRGTNFLLTIIMFVLIILENGERKKNQSIIMISVCWLISIVYISGLYVLILDSLAEILDYRLAKRIVAINNFLKTGDIEAAGGFSGRYELFLVSFSTWLSSIITFVIGAGDHRANNLIIGNHSEFTDAFARFGIIGGVVLIAVFYKHFCIQKKYIADNNFFSMNRQAVVVFVIYVLRNFLGTTMSAPNAAVMFLFLPLLPVICKKIEKRKRKDDII